MANIITIFIVIVGIISSFFIVKNNKILMIKTKNKFKIIRKLVIVIVSILFCRYVCIKVVDIKENINVYYKNIDNKKMFEENDNKINTEREFYKKEISKAYQNQSFDKPYIPDGFLYVEGNWNNGYVIKDGNENEYVWIPCTNKENLEVPILAKRNFCNNSFISKDLCYDENYEKFIKSALENGGFYVSRYEIGNEGNKPVSKRDVLIWKDINRKDSIELAEKMYDGNNINSELINGYAYDTMLKWIYDTNKKIEIIEIEKKQQYYTGNSKPYNNIYGLFDNILENTLEISYDTYIIRGNYKQENDFTKLEDTRYSVLKSIEDFTVFPEEITFRIVLYK